MSKITKGSRVSGSIQYFKFRLAIGERMICNCKQPHMVHSTTQDTDKQPIMILQEAIRSDDTIGEARCEEHAKDDWHVTVDRENHKLRVVRP